MKPAQVDLKLGVVPTLRALEFWKSLQLGVAWSVAEMKDLVATDVVGIFVDPDESDAILGQFKEIPRHVVECRFVDFIENRKNHHLPKSYMRTYGKEIFACGVRGLDIRLRAYITGVGPWARVFGLLAVEAGYSHISWVVEEAEQAREISEQLRRFCFGVQFEALKHSELTLQPNNGSLLVNTLSPASNPELIQDLAYLNFLSPQGLLIDTCEGEARHELLIEAKNSTIAILDANFTKGFAEYQALQAYPGLLPWKLDEYLEKRRKFFLEAGAKG